jgi:hypothetical protein
MRRGFNWSLVSSVVRTEVLAYQNRLPLLPSVPLLLRCSIQATQPTRAHIRRFTMSKPSNPLNNPQDPIERTSSPYQSPYHIGPKSKLLSTRTGSKSSTRRQTSSPPAAAIPSPHGHTHTHTLAHLPTPTNIGVYLDYHSTSLRMVSNTVNKVRLVLLQRQAED